jgi:preprotein translocase SecE subunit
MARQTRSERRARRAAQQESQSAAQRARPRQQQQQQQLRPAPEPASADGGRHVPGSGFRNFVIESWGELKKVDWPGQQQLVQGTAVVLIACLITGTYLFIADEIFRRFVQHVLLGG